MEVIYRFIAGSRFSLVHAGLIVLTRPLSGLKFGEETKLTAGAASLEMKHA